MSGRNPVHYEVFSRRTPASSWVLQLASEDRALATATAEELLATAQAAAVRVNKEMLNLETGEYSSATVLTKGTIEDKKKVRRAPESEAACTSPQDLYTLHAREKIARLLEDWLRRNKAVPFELLHNPDLARRLDDSGNELQHAVQKISVAEAQDSGVDLHELMRRWQGLTERAVKRILADGQKKLFPAIDGDFPAVAARCAELPEKHYVLGGSIAIALAGEASAGQKLNRLLHFAQSLGGDTSHWAFPVIEAPVAELFALKTTMTQLLGDEADLGSSLAVMTVMAAGPQVEAMIERDPKIAELLPPLTGAVAGFARLIEAGAFPVLANQLSRRLVQDLKGPRRLRPNDPESEIEILRALALCLTTLGQDSQREDIHEAFVERSRMLVSADFVDSLSRMTATAFEEAEKLTWLGENVAGGANKRQAARWLIASLGSLKFERALRDPARPPTARLSWLAQMQKRMAATGFPEKDCEEINARLGHIGGLVASDVHLIAQIAKSPMPAVKKLQFLLSFATGHAAPIGPAATEAKMEVMKQLRNPEVRQGLMSDPQTLMTLKPMLQAAGLAA
ncbi:MAG: hypothetical protein ACXU8U_03315 [Asticcacaulis sp.]